MSRKLARFIGYRLSQGLKFSWLKDVPTYAIANEQPGERGFTPKLDVPSSRILRKVIVIPTRRLRWSAARNESDSRTSNELLSIKPRGIPHIAHERAKHVMIYRGETQPCYATS